MTAATRERKIKFFEGFGGNALEKAIMAAVYRHGAEHFLTDEQLDEITSEQVRDWRATQKRNRENRRVYAKQRAAA